MSCCRSAQGGDRGLQSGIQHVCLGARRKCCMSCGRPKDLRCCSCSADLSSISLRGLLTGRKSHVSVGVASVFVMCLQLNGTQLPLVKLCDFGFSKDKFDDSEPQTQIGTALFTAPEIFTNTQGQVSSSVGGWTLRRWLRYCAGPRQLALIRNCCWPCFCF
jgi:serine/threonine protein kinase